MISKYNRIKKYNKQLYILAIITVTLFIGILFYALNFYTPLFADDYSYSFSYSTGERITAVHQIIDSQIAHYQKVNGRSVVHFLAQLFLLLGDRAFNIINTVFFLVLIVLIYFHACGTFQSFSLAKFSVIAILLFLSCPSFGQSFLWITGAANYMYGMLIILLFLLPYRIQANVGSSRHSVLSEIISAVLYPILGIIAGWTNENTSVAMVVIMIAYLVFFRLQGIKIHAWNITGCIGGVIGCIFLLLSPGTNGRMDSAGGSGSIVSWLKRMFFYTCDIFSNLQYIVLLFGALFILYLYQKRCFIKKSPFKEAVKNFGDIGLTLIYVIGFLASVYSMIVSPQFPGRVWSGPVILAIISVINLSTLTRTEDFKAKIGKAFIIVFLSVLCLSVYVNAFYDMKNVNEAYSERISIIKESAENNEKDIEIPSIYGWSGYSCYESVGDLNDDSNEWPNTAIAKYYGVDQIICSD